jgi:pimeloyl-ACP methyl ester carboxylesterase
LNYDNRTMRVGTVEVGFRLDGQGGSHVVLLHGKNSHSGTWRKNFPALVGTNMVFAPSLHSLSGEVTSDIVGSYANVVAEMAVDLGISDAAVVGNSMGGWVAIRLALLDPKRFSRLVLEDTAGATSDEARALGSAPVPTLIIWGENDGIFRVGVGRELSSRLPGSSFQMVRGAGHIPHWERPDEFNGLLNGFLSLRAR